jgi:protein SCO1/2/putative membrane protein
MRTPVIVLLTLLTAALWLAAYSLRPKRPAPENDDYGAVGDFALTERGGRTVTAADLAGKVWVAAFTFTRCNGPCPQVSGTMAHLQHDLAGEPDVVLVSFAVDPEHDTPEVLRDYARKFGADPERWLFLTGKRDDVYRVIVKGFHLGVQQNEGAARQPGSEVTHSTRLAVVDRRGHVRGYFDGAPQEGGDEAFARLRGKIADLLRERP